METFCSKIELINYFDDLINRVDIDIEECLKYYKEDELLEQKIQFSCYEKFEICFFDLLQEKEEETVDLWSEKTKVVDYLNQVRMRTIEELRKKQIDSVENSSQFNYLRVSITDETKKEEIKSQLFADKFCFQVKITKQEYKKWYFNLFTFVTDFYMSPFEIHLLEELIRIKRTSKILFDEKMVLIGLLYKCFCENFTTRKFPNQIIHVFKQDLLKIKQLTVKYPIRGVNLNGSSNYLSKLEHLDLNISHYLQEELEEVNIENLPSLEFFSLKSYKLKRITLKSLNALKQISLDICYLKTSLQTDLCVQMPNIEDFNLVFDLFRFNMLKKNFTISYLAHGDFDFASIYTFCHQIEKLEINNSSFKSSELISFCQNFTNLFELNIHDCSIVQIEKKLFDGLSNLRSLSLRSSWIQTIDFDAFSHLKNLVKLDLNYIEFESLDKRTFSELVNLEILNLSGNRIKSLDENIFSNLKNLRELDLRYNQLERLDHKLFDGLENLYELDLSVNKLEYFDARVLDNLPRLKKIILSRKSLSHDETEILKRFQESGIEFNFNI